MSSLHGVSLWSSCCSQPKLSGAMITPNPINDNENQYRLISKQKNSLLLKKLHSTLTSRFLSR